MTLEELSFVNFFEEPMEVLPENVQSYKKTPIFDEGSIPAGLLKDHSTKIGVWGKINILEGKLLYVIQSDPREEIELTPENCGIVEPERKHFIKPVGKVRFFVEFLK